MIALTYERISTEIVSNTNPDWVKGKTPLTTVFPNSIYVCFKKGLDDKSNILQPCVKYFFTEFKTERHLVTHTLFI